MGKQISIAMEYEDEQKFLSFLRSTSDIILIESFAPCMELLWKNNFEKEFVCHHTYYIWNKKFSWQPEYSQAKAEKFYIANKNDAPLLQFSRSNIKENIFGRIYWSKYFAAPHGLHYDVDEFNKWYEDISKWIKKNSAGKVKNEMITYFLPEAWDEYNKFSLS